MDYIGVIERALSALRQLLSFITSRRGWASKNSFLHKAYLFVSSAISTLEQMESQAKKQWNRVLALILSTAWLVVQNLYSEAVFNAIQQVTREVGNVFEGRIPEYIAIQYDELQRILENTSEKVENIQSTCYSLIEQVKKACECNWTNPLTVPNLKATRLKASVEIRDCEQSVDRAHEIIQFLDSKIKEEAIKLGLGFAFCAVFTLVLGTGALKAIQNGAKLRAGLMGCGGVVGAICCVLVAMRLKDYKVAWEELSRNRCQYRQLGIHLDALRDTVEKDLKEGVQLIGILEWNRAITVSVTFLAFIAYLVIYYCADQTGHHRLEHTMT